MKGKAPLYSVLVLLILPVSVFGQKDYHNGYIITNKNDTLNGRIKDRKPPPFGKLFKKVRFKHKNIIARKYGPEKLKGYKQGNDQYESLWIDVSNSFFRETYLSIPDSGEKRFLRVIVKGYLTYYKWEYEDDESDYIWSKPLFKREDEPSLIRVTQGVFGLKKKNLAKYFRDCPTLVDKIENGELKDPLEIANYYNDWKVENSQKGSLNNSK